LSIENVQPGSERNRRIFHWTVTAAFFVLLLSGLVLYTPAVSSLAEGGWTRIAHRVAAVSLAVMIASYVAIDHRGALAWLKDAAIWTAGASVNPDTWKRKHKLLITLGVMVFAVTGFIQWFLKDAVPRDAFPISVMVHDVAFFGAIIVLLLHAYHEFDWWRWKKRHCGSCLAPLCRRVCPSDSVYTRSDGTVARDDLCNNCRLCMETCRKNGYYRRPVRNLDKAIHQAE
jgi:cytochrome b subunit of formate dehydrogenase